MKFENNGVRAHAAARNPVNTTTRQPRQWPRIVTLPREAPVSTGHNSDFSPLIREFLDDCGYGR